MIGQAEERGDGLRPPLATRWETSTRVYYGPPLNPLHSPPFPGDAACSILPLVGSTLGQAFEKRPRLDKTIFVGGSTARDATASTADLYRRSVIALGPRELITPRIGGIDHATRAPGSPPMPSISWAHRLVSIVPRGAHGRDGDVTRALASQRCRDDDYQEGR